MKSAVAFVFCAPFITWVVTAIAAHPSLVGIAPAILAKAGGVVFLLLLFWVGGAGVVSRMKLHPAFAAGLLFGTAALVGAVFGFDPAGGVAAAVIFCFIALAGNQLYRLAEAGAWSAFVTAWLCSGIVLCVVALAAMATRRPALLYAFSHGRAIGIFENPNELGLFTLSVAAVACGALLVGTQRYRARPLAVTALALAIVTLVATGSRSGEAAFALGALIFGAMFVRGRAALGALALVAILGLAVAYGVDRRHNPAENESRLAAWHAGIRTVALFPLTGVGMGAYYRVYPAVREPDAPGPDDPIAFDPHDFYLSVAGETGLLGLSGLIWTMVVFTRHARIVLLRGEVAERRFAIAISAGLVAIAVDLLFNAFALSIVLWSFMAALLFAAARSVRAAAE